MRQPDAYPESPSAVQSIETHFAWVFLGDDYAYKLKKPVRVGEQDLSSIGARAFNCAEEVRLNRRLAPTVYLGIVPLTRDSNDRISVDGMGEVVDWLVKMRKLPHDAMLDRAIAAGSVRSEQVRAVGEMLARFYARQPVIDLRADAYMRRMHLRVDEDRRELLDPALELDVERVEQMLTAQRQALELLTSELGSRAAQGRILEAHGDLRPEHVCLVDPPCVIDTLEFSLDLRTLDPVEELAYFHLECELLGAGWVGSTVVDVYRALSSDGFTPALFDFYRSRRAAVRAKVIAWHLLDPLYRDNAPWAARANVYVGRALTYAQAASSA